MRVAQQLYEGIELKEGAIGLITYMRTDSVHLAVEAVAEIREMIRSHYGENSLPKEPQTFKTKIKNAQEAHEAIRPTQAGFLPDAIKPFLTSDQYKLYTLIWQRTIACQMAAAIFHSVSAELSCGTGNLFKATG